MPDRRPHWAGTLHKKLRKPREAGPLFNRLLIVPIDLSYANLTIPGNTGHRLVTTVRGLLHGRVGAWGLLERVNE
ncbi:hypothetical protein ABZS81_14900 [Streptomyces sp. NPDC005318]|uniref:hypothetical protein n=1 Tax=Streptomyces sp. NPDC005318 TaxID=3157031 RepID=UPI00339F2D7D